MVGSLPEETEKRTVESSGLEADPAGTAVGGAKSELPLRPPGRKRRQGAVQPQGERILCRHGLITLLRAE